MALRKYLILAKRWWWLLILLPLLGGGSGIVIGSLRQPVYEASTTILINQAPGALPDAEAVIAGQRVASTYAELLHQRPVLEAVIGKLSLGFPADVLEGKVKIEPIINTNLLVVTVIDTDSRRAADIANTIVSVFIQQNIEYQAARHAESLANLETEMLNLQADITQTQTALVGLQNAATAEELAERSRLQTLLVQQQNSHALLLDRYEEVRLIEAQTTDRITVVEYALPGNRAGQSTTVLVLQGVVAGFIIAGGTALLIEYLRETVSSSKDLEKMLGVPTLATIGRISEGKKKNALITAIKPRSVIAEGYRALRANVEFASTNAPIRTLLVTSSVPSEGKTTTATNLAIAMAQSGKRVILVDTDLRRPSVHGYFRNSNELGITTVLMKANGSTSHCIQQTEIPNLYIFPSGPLPLNPADLLGSPQMTQIVQDLGTQADLVIFDSPPVLPVIDSSIMARLCDATLLVVLAEGTQGEVVRNATEQLTQAGARVLGTVLNNARVSSNGYHYGRYYSAEE